MRTPSLLLLLLSTTFCFAQKDSLQKANPEKVWQIVEKMPNFRGGWPAWEQYVRQHLRYPEEAKRAEVKGSVYVGFTVCEDGSILNPELLRGIGYECDQEALRLVSEMPNLVPGQQNGRTVPVYLIWPVKFLPKL